MNQAIQFPDREVWDEGKQAVCFPVLVNGVQLTCAIAGELLLKRFGGTSPLDVFRDHRWDLEEEASDMIRDEQEDAQGWVWFS
ncbi:DUF1488 family protein [Lelliottia wanjuensis]|uniref:DUF1488 domain-containing protein n=1 Tax=Lelliottia wanjuensis TaxID=3050585 RepID=UPI00254CECA9|nr:DUF1488 domain-containing protein [Lelliottia sp. V104_15]MDK9604549.1 DUF1488 domain-containing protein [Lelliottia sp. V104_15]